MYRMTVQHTEGDVFDSLTRAETFNTFDFSQIPSLISLMLKALGLMQLGEGCEFVFKLRRTRDD